MESAAGMVQAAWRGMISLRGAVECAGDLRGIEQHRVQAGVDGIVDLVSTSLFELTYSFSDFPFVIDSPTP